MWRPCLSPESLMTVKWGLLIWIHWSAAADAKPHEAAHSRGKNRKQRGMVAQF
jgi:hypothetical protein